MSLTCAKASRGDVNNKNRTNFFIAVYIKFFFWYKNIYKKSAEIGKIPTKKEDFPYLIGYNKKTSPHGTC